MLDLFNNLNSQSLISIAMISFLVGAISSLHCIGMCGGIMLATTQSFKEKLLYQFGRLSSYLIFAYLLSRLSSEVLKTLQNSNYIIVVTVLIGLLFVVFGLQKILKFKIKLKFLDKTYNYLFKKSLSLKSQGFKSFFIGMASIALPCSALYLFTFTLLSIVGFEYAFVGMFFFWIPTAIVLLFLGEFFSNFLTKKAPKNFQGAIYIVIGLSTLLYRFHIWENLEKYCH